MLLVLLIAGLYAYNPILMIEAGKSGNKPGTTGIQFQALVERNDELISAFAKRLCDWLKANDLAEDEETVKAICHFANTSNIKPLLTAIPFVSDELMKSNFGEKITKLLEFNMGSKTDGYCTRSDAYLYRRLRSILFHVQSADTPSTPQQHNFTPLDKMPTQIGSGLVARELMAVDWRTAGKRLLEWHSEKEIAYESANKNYQQTAPNLHEMEGKNLLHAVELPKKHNSSIKPGRRGIRGTGPLILLLTMSAIGVSAAARMLEDGPIQSSGVIGCMLWIIGSLMAITLAIGLCGGDCSGRGGPGPMR